jgi:excisionase family DNA binding protein
VKSQKNVPAPEVSSVSAKRGFDVHEAARYLGCTVSFIRQSIYAGNLRAVMLGHRRVVDRADLDSLFERLKASA